MHVGGVRLTVRRLDHNLQMQRNLYRMQLGHRPSGERRSTDLGFTGTVGAGSAAAEGTTAELGLDGALLAFTPKVALKTLRRYMRPPRSLICMNVRPVERLTERHSESADEN